MRLSRLELLGFKSFADRTVFEFGDDTLTGVVGPNGCGKSNVVDAVRWALGEQRPTSMRGKEMTDVIFKGCASRPGMSVAEATLVLDNESGVLADRGPEVSITRRVYKSGEGEYQIDGQKCRLKDVREMLFDTGLGSRGYSVLEQGRIDAVLSANAVDRRAIFEEAAGISRYRQRKHETELRLARVQQDLSRLDDLTSELRTRVRSLKIQAGKAERYVAARSEWERERTRLLKHQLCGLEEELERCTGRLQTLEEELSGLRGTREELAEAVEHLEQERAATATQLERLIAEATRLEGDSRALEERRNQIAARVGGWEKTAEEEAQRGEELAAQVTERARELAELEERKVELANLVAAAREVAEERARGRAELLRRYREVRASSQQQNEVVLGLLHDRTEAANSIRHLQDALGPAAERFERVAKRLEEGRSELDTARLHEAQAGERTGLAELSLQQADDSLRGLLERAAAEEERVRALDAEHARVLIEITRRESHIESLLDRERELEDLDAGARAVLAAVEGGEAPCRSDELVGLLADHIRTDTRYARALDAVLGERAHALVVSEPDVALSVATWLREQGGGQAALTVAGGLGEADPRYREPLPDELGARVLARLRDKLVCDERFGELADSLCGDVLVVEDLRSAHEIVRSAGGWRCVTPAGEWIDAAGLVGGERTLAQGPVGRRSSAAELESEVEELRSGARDTARELERRRVELTELQAQEAEASTVLDARRAELAEAKGELRTAEARSRDLQAATELLEAESASAVVEQRVMEEQLETARLRLADCERRFHEENAGLERIEAQRAAFEVERDESSNEENRARIDLTRSEEQLDALTRRIGDLCRVRSENETELERARRLADSAAESARLGGEENEQLGGQERELCEQRETVAEMLAEVRGHAETGDRKLGELRRELEGATREQEARSEAIGNERLDKQRIELSCEELLRRAQEELGLEREGLLDGFTPEEELEAEAALRALEECVRELRTTLDKMGPVNMDALGELEEVGGRLEFLDTQVADLNQARKSLAETLRRIETESERLFEKTFVEVRANFQRTFRRLFGGGKADVKLEEGVPVLEAGVEISARPPGREMLPIGLLSGGQRTMTALALLFAVFEARPSPFCVLDEVDAALDDANIQRFLGMLSGFRRTTQFVVVTHNKGTMAECEGLYGVTMQTKGVSRQVSVELEEVDEFVPEATGASAQADRVPLIEEPEAFVELEPVPAQLTGPEEAPAPAESDLDPALFGSVAAEPLVVDEEADPLEDESGEPVVELLPAHVVAEGVVAGGEAVREREVVVERPDTPEGEPSEVEPSETEPEPTLARELEPDPEPTDSPLPAMLVGSLTPAPEPPSAESAGHPLALEVGERPQGD